MRIIEQLVYKISGDNSEFDKSLAKSDKNVNKFGSVANKIFAGVTVAAIGMAMKKMGQMVIATSDALSRVSDLSQKIGISKKAFQEWDFILSQSGASVEGLQMAVKTLSGAADEASKGTLKYKESFDRLGVSVTDINGDMKDQETLFNEVFVALSNLDNQTERTALASDLLGRSATELGPAFNAGGDAIEEMRSKAHELGIVYSDELIDAGEELGDNIDRLKSLYQGLKTKALEPLIGLALTFTDKLLGQTSSSKDLNTQLTNLITTNSKYMLALDKVGESIEGVTDASLEQLAVQRDIQLFELEDTYFKSQKELAKLNEIIRINSDINTRNNKTLDDMAKKYGVSRLELARMAEAEQISTDDRDRHKDATDAVNESYRKYAEATNKATSATINQKQFVDALAQAHVENNLDISRFIELDSDLYEQILASTIAYEKNREEIERRNDSIERAKTVFKAYSNVTEDGLRTLIEATGRQKESAYNTEIVRLATEKLNEVLAEKARLAETEAEKEEARAEIIANTTKAISDAEKVSIALGDEYDLTASKVGIFTSAIETLIESGLEPTDESVQELIASLRDLGVTTEEVVDTNMVPKAQEMFDAYKIGYDKMRAEQKKVADEAEIQAERKKQAWVDASFGMLSSATSIWGSINQVQENQNKEEIQRIEEQNAIAIQAAKDRGASEEELTELEKSLQADLNDTKNQYAQEEAKRKKAQGTFSAIIDTASAVIGFLANPGGWEGWALSAGAAIAGAAQIAAINSAPMPSYEVGTINIPTDRVAQLHAGETVLTKGITEEAKQQGITIQPAGKTGGKTVPFVLLLDGREIARAVLDNVNTGSIGTIKARVVK